jgi:hypothetical protein
MIEWSIVLDRVLYGFPAAAAILLVISVLRAFWRLTRRVPWWMANGLEISRSSFEVYRDKVRKEPTLASPGEFEMGDFQYPCGRLRGDGGSTRSPRGGT